MTAEIIYKGELRTDCKHTNSGTVIEADAPIDNKGNGERFSPSDLIAAALGSCIITTMAIKMEEGDIDFAGTKIDVSKVMITNPRRVGEFVVNIHFSKSVHFDDKQKEMLQHLARACPVAKSLHPDLKQTINFFYE